MEAFATARRWFWSWARGATGDPRDRPGPCRSTACRVSVRLDVERSVLAARGVPASLVIPTARADAREDGTLVASRPCSAQHNDAGGRRRHHHGGRAAGRRDQVHGKGELDAATFVELDRVVGGERHHGFRSRRVGDAGRPRSGADRIESSHPHLIGDAVGQTRDGGGGLRALLRVSGPLARVVLSVLDVVAGDGGAVVVGRGPLHCEPGVSRGQLGSVRRVGGVRGGGGRRRGPLARARRI